MIIVKAIKCPYCKDTVYSRARHDFKVCRCGNCFIDGGLKYTRVGWTEEDKPPPIVFELEVNSNEIKLHNDFYQSTDKFGVIPDNGQYFGNESKQEIEKPG